MPKHCPECGFINDDGANYCQKCGSFIGSRANVEQATTTYRIGDTAEGDTIDIDTGIGSTGAVLVIRSGGGRAGEAFPVSGERTSIGRSPDAGVFLDDVTVSRNHALLVQRKDGIYIDDLGSLNGTYVNRKRIESRKLDNRDEIQIGKYKLSFLEQ